MLVCALLCISSCIVSKKDPLEYRTKAFAATISVEGEKVNFEAIFYLSPPDESGNADFRIEFTSPQSLKGLSAVQTGDVCGIYLDGKEFLSEDTALFRDLYIEKIARALSPTSPAATIKAENGYTVVSTKESVIYIDPSTSLPVKAVCKDENLTVIIKQFSFT